MSLRKFGPDDVILNTMRTYPPVKFFIHDGTMYYNSLPNKSGTISDNELALTGGGISLYEYNVDRKADISPFIYPFVTKGSSGQYFGSATSSTEYNAFDNGDILRGSYPLTAAISREYLSPPSSSIEGWDEYPGAYNKHYWALKNRLNYYGYLSEHFKVTSNYEDGWNKDVDTLNLISIPSIFFGSKIKEGSVSLKWYLTGTLVAELQDTKRNGELVQVTGTAEAMANGLTAVNGPSKIAGVVMYNEGFILLTGSWELNSETARLETAASGTATYPVPDNPRWIHFAAGAQDGMTAAVPADTFSKASFEINFQGQNDTQVYTMFAKAGRGEVNYSNNPTFLQSGSSLFNLTSAHVYEENPARLIKNTVSSSYPGYSASFKRQVFISRIGIYDVNRNLIGVATLADPVLKQEDDDYTFKLKLDI